jgi:tubulin delta
MMLNNFYYSKNDSESFVTGLDFSNPFLSTNINRYLSSHSQLFNNSFVQPVSVHHTSLSANHCVSGYLRSANALFNSQGILPLLKRSASKAHSMYETKAYVHQYTQYGLEEDDFVHAFHSIGSVINNYQSL